MEFINQNPDQVLIAHAQEIQKQDITKLADSKKTDQWKDHNSPWKLYKLAGWLSVENSNGEETVIAGKTSPVLP